jgi:hypothetical protein
MTAGGVVAFASDLFVRAKLNSHCPRDEMHRSFASLGQDDSSVVEPLAALLWSDKRLVADSVKARQSGVLCGPFYNPDHEPD